MTLLRFLLAWAALSAVASVVIGRAIARARLAQAPPVHLLTLRQVADVAGVSLAAVRSWQAEGLLPTEHCPACGRATVSFDAAARLCTTAANEDRPGAIIPEPVAIP